MTDADEKLGELSDRLFEESKKKGLTLTETRHELSAKWTFQDVSNISETLITIRRRNFTRLVG